MRTFESSMYPYWDGGDGEKLKLFAKKKFTIDNNLTILVGANGTGKTTTLHIIKECLTKINIPVIRYDNLHDGGSNAIGRYMGIGEIDKGIAAMTYSEGENIVSNIGDFAQMRLRKFVMSGKESIFSPEPESNERWILLDATDSGLSIDNVVDLKDFFRFVIDDGKKNGFDVYFVVSANEYEMAAGEQCLDVRKRVNKTFSSYDEFRNFIMQSRKIKDETIKGCS